MTALLTSPAAVCSITDFARLPMPTQAALVADEGILLDAFFDKDALIQLYYLKGFFVEVTFERDFLSATEIIPFQNGYKLKSYLRSPMQSGQRTFRQNARKNGKKTPDFLILN